MAQNITIANATYPSVPAIDVPKQGGGMARFSDASVTTATASDVKQGKIFVNAQGNQDAGTYVPTTPTGNINITQAGVTDVTNYATATVPVAIGSTEISDYYSTESSVRKYTVEADGLITDAGWVFLGYQQAFHGYKTYNAVPKNATITPTTSAQTIGGANYMMEGAVTISGDANLVAGNIKNGTTIFGVTGTYSGGGGTLTVATKTATLSAVGKTLSFTSLSGTPKYWFVKTTSQISSSGSTTIYYITDGFYDGTSVKGNSFRIGSTRRIYSWTSGVTQSYSGGTLTITGGSATGSSPGQWYNGTYELTYVY